MRLVHLADLHLGYRQYQRLTPQGINQREADVATAFKRAVDKVVGDLRAVRAPDKVKPLHDQLVGEISSYGKEIDKAKSAFAHGSPKAIVKAQTDLYRAVTRVSGQINRTIDAINKKLRE